MIKKIILIILLILGLIVGIYKFGYNIKIEDSDNTDNNTNYIDKVSTRAYSEAFEDFLNIYYIGGEEYQNNLISDTMYTGSRELDSTDDVVDNDTNIDNNTEYAILDYRGKVVGYGTKEDSKESIQRYGNVSVYTVKSCDQLNDELHIKVYNYLIDHAELFVVELNDELQMKSFSNMTNKE